MSELIICKNQQTALDHLSESSQQTFGDWENNPDVVFINREEESIKIEQIRKLSGEILYPPLRAGTKHFILFGFDKTTIPAQNAFLKSLEEPPEYIKFVLVTSSLKNVLETIKSRCHVIDLRAREKGGSAGSKDEVSSIYKKIISASHGQKIDIAGKYKDRDEAKKLLSSLLTFIHGENIATPSREKTHHLQTILKHQNHLGQNANVLLALEECFFELR